MTKNTAHTNFAAYSHQQLYAMLQAGDPNSARHAADKWKSAALHLHEQAHNLNSELTEFKDQWTGGAAEQYQHMIIDLANGISKVAQTAEAMNVMLGDAADALVKAKKEMPPPVSVPDVAPADVALAVNPPLLPPDASPAVVQAAAQQRQQAIANVEAQQAAANAAGSAHGKAIVVMTELAGEYTVAEESIPASPNAVQTPTTPPAGGGAGTGGSPSLVGNGMTGPGVIVTPADGHPLPSTNLPRPGTTAPTSNPLFGDMFTAGLAAASAAAFGRFGSIMPKVPSWATGKDPKDKKDEPAGTKLGGGGAGVEGGTGGGIPIGGGDAPSLGGGGGIPVGGGGLSGPGEVPAAHSGLAGDGGAGNALSGLAGGAAGAAGAAAAKGAMPMMPMMPMGMGGGGDMGSGRRIPAWLVETENVWGQSAPVAPPVIGEDGA
ncbi:WXG100 family type VII secretion target [Amycolatopsis sp. NPDC049688]|uniref:WXG100 family type VII secretion target n=1 Tax=Amycolatopsis sp. NPDC049688 TaxID=3154733 RepID=UPI003413E985